MSEQRQNADSSGAQGADLTWVEQVTTVDAIDRVAVAALDANPGWRLLHVGMGDGGQTTLTYGWPWEQSGSPNNA